MEALVRTPATPRFGYVVAHGAGAGMRHPFMEGIADALFSRDVATFRYEFLYMEQRKNRPDSPAVAAARVREAVAQARNEWPGLPLVAGGKSFGGRMTSTAQSEEPLRGVAGLAFLGFPLHAPGKPSLTRAEHLSRVQVPMLFLQGTRDEFAKLDLITEVTTGLGPRATLVLLEGADHSFKIPKRAAAGVGVPTDGVTGWLADQLVAWGESL